MGLQFDQFVNQVLKENETPIFKGVTPTSFKGTQLTPGSIKSLAIAAINGGRSVIFGHSGKIFRIEDPYTIKVNGDQVTFVSKFGTKTLPIEGLLGNPPKPKDSSKRGCSFKGGYTGCGGDDYGNHPGGR